MRYAGPAGGAAELWEIATPSRRARLPGVSMAGFRASSTDLVDMSVMPYPAVTVFIDFGDALLVDDASGQRQRGSVVTGLAPGAVFRGSAVTSIASKCGCRRWSRTLRWVPPPR